MQLQSPVDVLSPQLRERLSSLWSRTGASVLRQLLDGAAPFGDLPRAEDPRQRDTVCTCLMRVYQETGDREVFALLFELSSAGFLRAIRGLMHRSPPGLDADDVLQETFANMCRYPQKFVADRPDAFRRWGQRVARNALFTMSKRERRQPAPWSLDEPTLPQEDVRQRGPDRELAERESAAAVDRAYLLYLSLYLTCFEGLRERDRSLLTAAEIEQRAYRDIAAELGVRPCNVKMAVFRIRRRIAQRMENLLSALGCRGRTPLAEG